MWLARGRRARRGSSSTRWAGRLWTPAFAFLLGAYTFAWLVGFVVPFAPSGLGVGEATLERPARASAGGGPATALTVGLGSLMSRATSSRSVLSKRCDGRGTQGDGRVATAGRLRDAGERWSSSASPSSGSASESGARAPGGAVAGAGAEARAHDRRRLSRRVPPALRLVHRDCGPRARLRGSDGGVGAPGVFTAIHGVSRATYGEVFLPLGITALAVVCPNGRVRLRRARARARRRPCRTFGGTARAARHPARGRPARRSGEAGRFSASRSLLGVALLGADGIPMPCALLAAAAMADRPNARRGVSHVRAGRPRAPGPGRASGDRAVTLVETGLSHRAAARRGRRPRARDRAEHPRGARTPARPRRDFRGKEVFGANKTWRGVVVMSEGSTVVVFAQSELYALESFDAISVVDYSQTSWLALGLALGLGYSLAELPNSFAKRRLGTRPAASRASGGRPVRRRPGGLGDRRNARARDLPLGELGDAALVFAVGFSLHVVMDQLFFVFAVKRRGGAALGRSEVADVLADARVLLTGATGGWPVPRPGARADRLRAGPDRPRELARSCTRPRSCGTPEAASTRGADVLCGDLTQRGSGCGCATDAGCGRRSTSSCTPPRRPASRPHSRRHEPRTSPRRKTSSRSRSAHHGSGGSRTSPRPSSPGSAPGASSRPTSNTIEASRTPTSSRSTKRSCTSADADRLPVVVFRPSIVLDGPTRRVGVPSGTRSSSSVEAFCLPCRVARRRPSTSSRRRTPHARSQACCTWPTRAARTTSREETEAPTLENRRAVRSRFLGEDQFRWALSKWRHERPRLAPVYDELASFIFELAYPKVFDTSRAENCARRLGDEDQTPGIAGRHRGGRCRAVRVGALSRDRSPRQDAIVPHESACAGARRERSRATSTCRRGQVSRTRRRSPCRAHSACCWSRRRAATSRVSPRSSSQ